MAIFTTLLAVVLLAIITYAVRQRNAKATREALLAKFPLLTGLGTDIVPASRKGYLDYIKHGKPYCLRTMPTGVNDRIILPFKYLSEVKSSDENTGLSFVNFSDQSLLLKYSKGPYQTSACTYAVKQFLNRSMTNMTPLIHAGIMADIENTLPQTEDWSPVVLHPKIMSLVARNAARVLADPQLCDNEEWVQITVDITVQTFNAARSIRQNLNPAWYWLAPWLDQSTKDVLKRRRRAAEIVGPIYAAHKREAKSRGEKSSQQSTGMTWLLSSPNGERNPSAQQIADDLLFLSIAGIHTTTMSLMFAIHDLISHPAAYKYVREEVKQAYPEGEAWKASDLADLQILDSFLRESQRMHPVGLFTMSRAPYTNYKFQDGLELPADVIVSMSSQELNMDPDVFVNPEVFDAQRFLKLKQSTGLGKYAYTAIAEDISINFGAGQHACPGRSLASTTIKIALAELLVKYDLSFEDEKSPPKTLVLAATTRVDHDATFLVRKTASTVLKNLS